MNTSLKASSLVTKGMRIHQINHLTLFESIDELGDRIQPLRTYSTSKVR
ncbi:MAG: hypothetical protein ACK6CP_03175 [Pseudanabaena sp.]|nr:hypothetical protein [Pseudanabaena sp. M090S1SP2A07QC]MCA6507844.1 hypothetical protein [Pseudanabaena sp. M172S2SP2A07QC]MCA6528145.1 hypothetical protein [Pseudanabaena sp. M179S2SP2A07QC]MCA6536851.1 hypothetical protein [Pseudanabaena sp. M176S2SP2A07QC]MCA6537332.1 hypothetical protein [Pseudanabaena sp. M037S2SP2A07QC]MCA6554560.1 hypothetical protein [Pseudanabaena sp. M135S2SP2A07QC]MCA6558478.1 hypothetical protein [Pseudanabaena sp. M114S2SP2A07QC]MCA6560843.1 hypothetical prot